MSQQESAIVSFDDEPLILVSSDDQVKGYTSKREAHDGAGQLHRAFSVFVFDSQNRVLLQRRSASKRLWPGYWSNSCCSHPRRGEAMEAAVRRRVFEELGLEVEPTYLYRFEYHAEYLTEGSEHELCSVFVARSDQPPRSNENEVEEMAYLAPEALDAAMAAQPEAYTPWFKMEWSRLRRDHWPAITAL